MPAHFLPRLSTIGCNDFSREHVIEPLLADMQQEWAARRSVVALIRGYLACWSSLVVCFSRSMMTFPDREIAVRAIAPYVLATGGVMVVRLIGWAGWTRFGWRSTLIMALGALGFSPVFAMLPAMMKARRDVQARWSADFTKLLIAGAIVSAICVGWIGPELFRWYEVEFMHFPVASAGSQPAFQTLPTAAARAIA